jgi:hypothetical protein
MKPPTLADLRLLLSPVCYSLYFVRASQLQKKYKSHDLVLVGGSLTTVGQLRHSYK